MGKSETDRTSLGIDDGTTDTDTLGLSVGWIEGVDEIDGASEGNDVGKSETDGTSLGICDRTPGVLTELWCGVG